MSNDKPREFWINDNAEGDGSRNWSSTPWFGYIHVIEKSAYDKLLADNKRLREALQEISANKTQTIYNRSEDFMRGANAAFGQSAEVADKALADTAKGDE
jgi:hypothetical protein